MDRLKKNIVELTRWSEEDAANLEHIPLCLLADNVRSMHNIGAMLRTCDALGVREMIMGGISAVPPHPEISKTALGAERTVAWRHVEDAFEEVVRLKEGGMRVAVLEQTHGSVPLQSFRGDEVYEGRGGDWLLVAGNEVSGVDQRIVDIADVALEIPMRGVKHSLNVSVSAGIALWQIAVALRYYKS